MLDKLTEDNYLYWSCHDEDCARQMRAHIDDEAVCYHPAPRLVDGRREAQQKGSVIVLPPCPECGSQMFLKADYTLRDLRHELRNIAESYMFTMVFDDEQRCKGVVMSLAHARNFRLLNALHTLGKLPEPPILPVLDVESIKASSLFSQLPIDIVDAFWLGYITTGKPLEIADVDTQLRALGSTYNSPVLALPAAT